MVYQMEPGVHHYITESIWGADRTLMAQKAKKLAIGDLCG